MHMDDNIGRRLNALFDILTTVTSVEGEHPTYGDSGGGGLAGNGTNGLAADAIDEPLSPSALHPNFPINEETDNVFTSSSRVRPNEYPPFSTEYVLLK